MFSKKKFSVIILPLYLHFFFQKIEVSSIITFYIKKNFSIYVFYLQKLEIAAQILVGNNTIYWAIFVNKIYIEFQKDILNIQKIVSFKDLFIIEQKNTNKKIRKLQILVKCFFGQ
jgi:hypothetical protein